MIALAVALGCQAPAPEAPASADLHIALSGVELGFRPEIRHYVVRASDLEPLTTVRIDPDRPNDRFVLRVRSSTGVLLGDDVERTLALVPDTRLEIEGSVGGEPTTWWIAIVPEGLPLLEASGEDAGLSLFLTPRDYTAAYPPSGYGNYLLVVDGRGIPIWWRRTGGVAYDFRPAPHGELTALARLDGAPELEALRLDAHGEVVSRWLPAKPEAWTDVETDPHELWVDADGDWLQSVMGRGTLDLSPIGGEIEGEVRHSGLVAYQASGAVSAMWTTDAEVDIALLPDEVIAAASGAGAWRYAHVNSVDPLDDGWLVSLRSPGEMVRFSRETGERVWSLGGPASDFVFDGDPREGFFGQHSARWLEPNGVILFDNGTNLGSEPTGDGRVVAYALDLDAWTAQQVFEYVLDGVGGVAFGGSAQRLADGRTVVGFGSAQRWADGSRAPSIGVTTSTRNAV